MAGVNKVILIGNLGDEPSIRSTQTGTSVANASLCTSEKFKDQQGNTTEHNEWHRLVFWGRLADIVGQYCHKGSKLYVEGKIQSRQYDDKEGIKRTAFEIVVSEMQMLDSKNSGGNNNNNSYGGNNNSYGNTNNNAYGNNGNRNSSNNNRSQNYYSQNNSYGQQNQQQNNAYGSNVNSNQQQQMPQRSYQPQMQQNQPVNNFNNAQGFSNTNNAPQQQEPLNDDLPF